LAFGYPSESNVNPNMKMLIGVTRMVVLYKGDVEIISPKRVRKDPVINIPIYLTKESY
jgi:hypothetical protein